MKIMTYNVSWCKQEKIAWLIEHQDIDAFVSPGCLPGNMTVESIQLGETYQRNPLLASFCAKTMVYRGLGSGIIRAKKAGAKIEFRNDETTNQFITTIWRNIDKKGVSLEENSASNDKKGPSIEENSASNALKGPSSEEKGPSRKEKGPSSEEKGPSRKEKGPSREENSASNAIKGPSKKEQIVAKILKICNTPKSIPEIAECLGMSNRSKLRNNYINPLVGTKLAMTYPNSPKSPRQKYYTMN